jgi:putative ubiquitin-RnfH superfamily antitoxin RatB of RatAB toxin-antitoxin module
VCERSRRVQPLERVELYLPLSVDPKAARRARARPAR